VANGDVFTGNTTMLLEEGLDTGPILLQRAFGIAPELAAVELLDELAWGGAQLMVKTLAGLADGSIQPKPQNHEAATLAPILNREDGRMVFAARTATELKNRWRGFQPWPGAFTALDGKKLIVHRMSVVDASTFAAPIAAEPGRIHVEGHRLFVACAQKTWLELVEVQLEGKKRLTASEFLRGAVLAEGERLGAATP
jgi:methionyl-tRNA formyltransferase